MREKILEILSSAGNQSVSLKKIENQWGFPNVSHDEFLNIIDELNEDRLITKKSPDEYILSPFREGVFKILRSGRYVVDLDDKSITIDEKYINGAMDKDKVLVKITDFVHKKGTIKEIIERHGIVAEVVSVNNKRCIKINEDLFEMKIDASIVDGMLVGVKVSNGDPSKYVLDKVIGHKNAPKIDEKKILYDAGFPFKFSEKAIEELNSIPVSVSEEDIKDRRDLRKECIFTIDGDDTKDIDDAISIERNDNNYVLGVHIADVSHYVEENSAVDLDAQERCTSVYMPGVVNPMYPPRLSNGICSLNPDVDRLAISCVMEISPEGKLISFDIFKSAIHSRKQMTYKNVNKILNENIIPEGYEEFVPNLKMMNELALILDESRVKRGMLNFDSSEIKIEVDDDGKVKSISKRVQDTGEKLIESFMLAANECVATYVSDMGLDFIYRVHELPSEERLKIVINVIKNYGFYIKTKIDARDPKVIQKLLNELKDSDSYDIFSNMILRCMAKASYEVYNEGHFGIGINANNGEAYTHFTSPIRRLPDTLVHRTLTYILKGDFSIFENEDYKMKLAYLAKQSSRNEVLADKCGREADKMKMAEYMADFIGEEFKGKIVGFTMHGFFVQLDNLIEGRVGLNTMNDFFNYNEDLEMLIGKRSGKIYKLGDEVNIKLVKSEKESREIDFELVRTRKK